MSGSVLEFRGEVSPEVLTEEVEFKVLPHLIFCLAALIGILAFYLACMCFLAWRLIAKPHNSVNGLPFVGVVSVIAGLVAFAGLAYHWYGFSVVYDRKGMRVSRRGKILQECLWPETTLAEKGHVWKTYRLADQYGKALPVRSLIGPSFVRSIHVDWRLAELAAKTRASQLFAAKNLDERSVRKNRLGRRAVVLAAIFLAFLILLLFAPTIRSSVGLESKQLVSMLLGEILLALVYVITFMSAIVGGEFASLRTRASAKRKYSQLASFIEKRNGMLTAVEMVPGRWYRYVDVVGLRAMGSGPETGAFITILSLVIVLAGIWSIAVRHDGGGFIFIFYGAGVGALSVLAYIQGLRLARPMNGIFSRNGDQLTLRTANGKTVTCDVIKDPVLNRASSVRFGRLTVKLKGEDGRTYLIDPRYLVAVDGQEMEQFLTPDSATV